MEAESAEERDPQEPTTLESGPRESSIQRWDRTVRFSRSGGGFAYRPGELVIDKSALGDLVELVGRDDFPVAELGPTLLWVSDIPDELVRAVGPAEIRAHPGVVRLLRKPHFLWGRIAGKL